MGYHFGPEGLAIAQKTLDNFVERATRLYEQGPGEPCGSNRFGEYIQRWVRWEVAGLANIGLEIHGCFLYIMSDTRNRPSLNRPLKNFPLSTKSGPAPGGSYGV